MSFVDDVRKQIESRLGELKPLVDEYQQLEKLASGWIDDARGRVPGLSSRGKRGRRSTASSRASSTKSTGTRGRASGGRRRASASTASKSTGTRTGTRRTGARRGAPRGRRGGNTRANQALALVKSRPGITIPDIAREMGIKQNYLYRVLPGLEKEGKVKRKDRGWAAK